MEMDMSMTEYQEYARDMLDFIERSPSCFHAVDNIRRSLAYAGFEELKETETWKLAPGGGYFVIRNDSSLIAFRLPEQKEISGFHIAAAHSDSPTFKVKEEPEMTVEDRYIRLNTEKYGGMILSTWLDRPLSVAGRIAVFNAGAAEGEKAEWDGAGQGRIGQEKMEQDGAGQGRTGRDRIGQDRIRQEKMKPNGTGQGGIKQEKMKPNGTGQESVEQDGTGQDSTGQERTEQSEKKGKDTISTKLVNIDKDLLVIPNLAIHMNREMNKGVEYNPQIDMLPLFADCAESRGRGALLKKAAEAAGIGQEQILGHDLFLYVREKGRILGENGEFILSPRLDDLQCVYAAVKAFQESRPVDYINVCAVFDNEEIGSSTRQGADSTFLEDVLMRVGEGLEAGRSQFLQWVAGSLLISADNAHGVHPNHPEKADPTSRPYLNGGIVIKYHGGQKYTTDGVSAAKMKNICIRAGVPFQAYANRSDIMGGSTLGNISSAHVSVSSVDIGLPQLAMHSAVETAGTKDTAYAVKAFRMFFGE